MQIMDQNNRKRKNYCEFAQEASRPDIKRWKHNSGFPVTPISIQEEREPEIQDSGCSRVQGKLELSTYSKILPLHAFATKLKEVICCPLLTEQSVAKKPTQRRVQ